MVLTHEDNTKVICTKPWTSFEIVDHKGNVKPCCWLSYYCGNINNSTIDDIWNGNAFQRARHNMAEGNIDTMCAIDCPYKIGEQKDIRYPRARLNTFSKNQILQQEDIALRRTIVQSRASIMSYVPDITCNLKCRICYIDFSDNIELPHNIDEIIESEFSTLQELWLVGGEPFFSNRFTEIIKKMDQLKYPDLHLGLITNGTLINDNVIEILKDRQLSWILVSVDAANEETYRKIRGGKLSNVVEGIEKLKALKNQQNGLWDLRMNFVVMKSNVWEIREFIDLAHDLGVGIQFTPVYGNDHKESYYKDKTTTARIYKEIKEIEAYLEKKGYDKIRFKRVLSRLDAAINTPDSSDSKEMYFDGDSALEFNDWENRYGR